MNRNSYRAAKGNGFAPAVDDRLLTDGYATTCSVQFGASGTHRTNR